MGITGRLLDVESWLTLVSESWRSLDDSEYRELVRDWIVRFRPLIRGGQYVLAGHRAIAALEEHLPAEVVLFSGARIEEIGNLGGACAAAYRAERLGALDAALLRHRELIACAPDLSWTCLFSHETGSFFQELLSGDLAS
ncbi:MAG: hypothetical protein RL885_32250 [Planctomycetota bacterium]